MASKAFREELLRKTGHDLSWFSNAFAGLRGGLSDVHAHLRDFENMRVAAKAARETAKELTEIADLLDPQAPAVPSQSAVAGMKTRRTSLTFGCKTLGYVSREDCRDEHEEWRRLGELAKTKGYEILSHDGDVAVVRLPC
jgi:hypothetical protein